MQQIQTEQPIDPKAYWRTPYLQAVIAGCALCVAASAGLITLHVWSTDRNARLVEIGISVLRADPKKEPSTAAARLWALDLIDANAGGVKFSRAARSELLEQVLPTAPYGYTYYDTGGYNDPPGDPRKKTPKSK